MCSCNQTAIFPRPQKHTIHYCTVQTRLSTPWHSCSIESSTQDSTSSSAFTWVSMPILTTFPLTPVFIGHCADQMRSLHFITVQLFCFQPADETPSKQEGWTELTDWGSSTASFPSICKPHGHPNSQSINIVFLNSHSCNFCSIHCNGTILSKDVAIRCYTDAECTGYTQMIHTVTISTVRWFPA